jgi:uncharacterized membrane protein YdjX (TVP38/TMEM64 family)
VTLGGVLVGVAVALAIPSLRNAVSDAIHGDTAAVRQDLNGNAAGALLVVWLAMVHVVVWYPAEILDAAAGYVFGFGVGFPLVLGCWILSGLASYAVGRNFARPVLYRVVGEERFLRLERLVHRGGAPFLLGVRLIPIMPFSLMGYVCGAARISLWRYVWTTAVGYAPITAYFTYVGSQLEGFSAEDPILWIGGAVLIVAIFGMRFLLPRTTATDSGGGE